MLSSLFGKKSNLCPLANQCSGCEWITTPLSTQQINKATEMTNLLLEYDIPHSEKITVASLGVSAERLFVDLSFERVGDQAILGLYDIEREHLVDIGRCPATTKDVQDLIEALRDDPPPIDRASFRLRVNPHGQWGLWIDAANIDIRTLLNEARWLTRWMDKAHIELGQRRKYLQQSNQRLKLEAPFLRHWFSTYLPSTNQQFILWSVVGGFSQPSTKGVKYLVQQIERLMQPYSDLGTWLEFGSGSGTFTLPLSHLVQKVIATESSPLARKALTQALKHHKVENVVVSPLNIQRQTKASVELLEQADAMLVDPPRSGLGHTLQTIEKATRKPQVILYVSCHGRTLCKDGQQLRTMGYALQQIQGIDQFPNTPHCEWISVWVHNSLRSL